MAVAVTAVESAFFHQHKLEPYRYSKQASTYLCAVCERIVTSIGYRCDECNFNIHEACMVLPRSISFVKHREHNLALVRLSASRWCDTCKKTSHAGTFIYLCRKCNYDVHPRCTSLLQPQEEVGEARHGGTLGLVLKVGIVCLRVVDVFTGGIFS